MTRRPLGARSTRWHRRVLRRAGAQVVANRPDAQLWVAGDGDDDYVRRLHDMVPKPKLQGTGIPSQ